MTATATNGSTLFSNQIAAIAHLVHPGGGLSGELYDLRKDLASVLAMLAPITVDEFTNAPIADVDAIKTSIATATTLGGVTYSGAQLNGVVGQTAMVPPRNITVTTSDHAATWQGDLVVTGTDVNGDELTDTLALANNTTVVGVCAFKTVTSLHIDAQVDALGTYSVGFGHKIGLLKPAKVRAGAVVPVREVAGGSVVTNGVFAIPTTGKPNGTYAPNTTPDGATDYAVYYEFDPLA